MLRTEEDRLIDRDERGEGNCENDCLEGCVGACGVAHLATTERYMRENGAGWDRP